MNQSTKFNLAVGIKTRFLIVYKDNFQDIIFEKILLWPEKYNKIVFAPNFGLSLEKELPQGHILELGFFGNFNLNTLVDKDKMWGFFSNLEPAKNRELGLSLKYFL